MFLRYLLLVGLGLVCFLTITLTHLAAGVAQSQEAVESQEDAVIKQYSLPKAPTQAPVVQPRSQPAPRPARNNTSAPRPTPAPGRPNSAPRSPAPPNTPNTAAPATSSDDAQSNETQTTEASTSSSSREYILQFNRSPIVGNALQMQGVLSDARIGFTRPRHWDVASAKVQIRFRHSPALFAERSNLIVRLNNIHLGSVPLNRAADEIGNVLFNIPTDLLQDYNTIVMQVQQHTSADCTDPTDPALWTEILPDSKVIINYRPQAIALDLANYPYPFLDDLGLDADQLTFLRPNSVDDAWMTAAARYQAAAARLTNFRPIKTRLIQDLEELKPEKPEEQEKREERLVVIGTPQNQPLLSQLALPFAIKDGKFLDGSENILPDDVGLIMLTTTQDSSVPVLVMAGNDAQGVLKAVQALVQPSDRQLLTGQAALVSEVAEIESPAEEDWEGFLPHGKNRFLLSDLQTENLQSFEDVTVNGLPVPPPIKIPFKLLPNEQLLKGSTFTLRYSYGPNVDPARSSVSVRLNGLGVGGERLRNRNGGTDSITVNLPAESVTPSSNLEVQFFTYPNTPLSCGNIPDQPMWGTVHSNSSFNLNSTSIVKLPDLKLFQTGFPLTAPQDLSKTSLVLPERPTDAELLTMLYASSRLGRLSRADSVKLVAYTGSSLPSENREQHNLVGIGTRDRFPLPELFEGGSGLSLGEQFTRRQNQSQVQTLSDEAGVIEARVSSWNQDRVFLGLTGQSEQGLANVQAVFSRDSLFSQLEGDTLLVQQTEDNSTQLLADDFQVVSLTQNATKTIDRRGLLVRLIATLQANWFLLPGGIVLISLLFYGISQLFLNRLSQSGEV